MKLLKSLILSFTICCNVTAFAQKDTVGHETFVSINAGVTLPLAGEGVSLMPGAKINLGVEQTIIRNKTGVLINMCLGDNALNDKEYEQLNSPPNADYPQKWFMGGVYTKVAEMFHLRIEAGYAYIQAPELEYSMTPFTSHYVGTTYTTDIQAANLWVFAYDIGLSAVINPNAGITCQLSADYCNASKNNAVIETDYSYPGGLPSSSSSNYTHKVPFQIINLYFSIGLVCHLWQ